jgi:hypothetical protein
LPCLKSKEAGTTDNLLIRLLRDVKVLFSSRAADRVSSAYQLHPDKYCGCRSEWDGKPDVSGTFNIAGPFYLSNEDGSSASGASYNIAPNQTTETALSVGDFNGDYLVEVSENAPFSCCKPMWLFGFIMDLVWRDSVASFTSRT